VVLHIGTANNAGAILVLGRDLVVVPKLIHPLPPAISSPETSPERHIDDTWMQVILLPKCFTIKVINCSNNFVEVFFFPFSLFIHHPASFFFLLYCVCYQELNANRPPTPTRGRPQVANDRGSLAWI